MDKLAADLKADVFRDYSLEEYKNLNTGLYEDVIGKAYETSYANPAFVIPLRRDKRNDCVCI